MPSRKPTSAVPLQRGSACLSCRRRKLKCDGTRPICTQCTKMTRECEYDDKKQKSRTQKLKEKLSMLEQRLRELEAENGGAMSPDSGSDSNSLLGLPLTQNSSPEIPAALSLSPTMFPVLDSDLLGGNFDNLFDNAWSSSSGSSLYGNNSGYGTPGNMELDPSTLLLDDDSDQAIPPFLEMSPFSSLASTSEFPYMPRWNPQEPLPYESKKILLDIFLAHRHQCWFDGSVERFSLSNTAHQFGFEPHPSLMNAVYLLACHFARSPYCTEIEPVFFSRTLHEITVALDNSDRLVDVVQASCLLAVYLYINCRSLEGYCHSFSAARLAVGLGMHQIKRFLPLDDMNGAAVEDITPIPIPPPRDRAEVADRISAFWQVFMVDRCWSVASGLPVALPDGDCPQVRITTPWPSSSFDPVPPTTLFGAAANTVSELFEHQPVISLESDALHMPTLRAKAAAFYERTYRLASASKKSDVYWADHHSAELALQRFSMNLPAFVGYEAWRTTAPLIDVDLFAVHTMMHVATLHLYKDSPGPETFQAGNLVLSYIRQLNDGDYEYLDPILSSCWSTTARAYIQMMKIAGHQIESVVMYSLSVIEQELEVILNAMKTLSAFFPLSGDHAMKVEQEAAHARTNLAL
ncbi:adenylate kinase [Mycena indigotica]|uniref:Adenylate kinase n=1 Tax=Mycena indigotica TaxID=2126181 RepID=A0A8H6W087_9AGAR|nr:adenylate kinase [Mycena indigotica]KAF7294639.1 adenylate kinase [Mycena indigotica]